MISNDNRSTAASSQFQFYGSSINEQGLATPITNCDTLNSTVLDYRPIIEEKSLDGVVQIDLEDSEQNIVNKNKIGPTTDIMLLTRDQQKLLKSQKVAMRHIMERIFASFTFKFNMLISRSLCKRMKYFIEKRMKQINNDRLLFYSFKPGYVYPTRDNKIIQLTNKCHLFFWRMFPDYNHWMFNYILKNSAELFIVVDELNPARLRWCCQLFKDAKCIKYLKILNVHISASSINSIIRSAERVCLKNLIFEQLTKEKVESECRYLTMKGCSDLQNLENTKFNKCEQANFIHCEMLKDSLQMFSDKLKVLTVRRTYSVDDLYCHYLATQCSKFTNMRVLDLSHNQIEMRGLLMLLSPYSAYARNIQKLSVEGNVIVGCLTQVVKQILSGATATAVALDNPFAKQLAKESQIRDQSNINQDFVIPSKHKLSGMITDMNIVNADLLMPNSKKLSVQKLAEKERMGQYGLLSLQYVDLTMNQIDWENEWIRQQGFFIKQNWREKKKIRINPNNGQTITGPGTGGEDKEVKVKGVEIGIDQDLIIKVMNKDYMWRY